MNRFFQFFLGLLIVCSLAGCDQFREKLAALLQDKTPQQINQEAQNALAEGDPKKALELTKPYLEKPKYAEPPLLLTTARAYAQLGDVSQMISILNILIQTQALDKTQLMNDGAFESVRTDIRFVSWLANVSSDSDRKQLDILTESAPGVSAEINSGGVSARAGNVSVKIGK